jgi:hypothetical protein
MAIRAELSFRLPNSPGALAGIYQILAAERVGVRALSLAGAGQVRVVVDNPGRASLALRAAHHQISERHVLCIAVGDDRTNRTPAGASEALAALLTLVSDGGINVEYAYTGTGESAASTMIVLGTDDAMRAAALVGV